jgi:hypothetical protein
MKDEANRLGKKYGFSETDFRKRGKNSRTAVEKKIILKGGISWKEELREVIAEATKKSRTLDKFKEYLEKCYGVKITRDGKDFSYLHPEKQKPIRGEKLGTNYSKKEILRKIDEQNNGRISSAHNRGPTGGYFKKSSDIGFARRSKKINSRSARGNVFASIGDIERAMQRLDFDAKCANRGTDAASEELRMEQQKARERAESRRLAALERSEREQQPVVEEPQPNAGEDIGNGNGNRAPSKYSYGKGD